MLLGELLHGMKDSMYRKTTDWNGKMKDAGDKEKRLVELKNELIEAKKNPDTKAKQINIKDIEAAIQEIESQLSTNSTHDSPDYYNMIVQLSRTDNNIKGNRGLAQRQSQRAIEANGQKFDEGEFNKAFEEFKGAQISKAAFYKGPKDSKTGDVDHSKCEECGKLYNNEELGGGGGRAFVRTYGGEVLDVCKKCAEKIKNETKTSDDQSDADKVKIEHLKEYIKTYPDAPETISKRKELKELESKTKDARGNVNHLGERQFDTYEEWRRAVRLIDPNVKFDGDKETCNGGNVGEWDGAHGIIYGD